LLLLSSVVIGLGAGLLIGGRPGNLFNLRIRGLPFFLVAFLLQVMLFVGPLSANPVLKTYGPWIYVASLALVLGALATNLRTQGFAVVFLGALLNFTVVAANGGHMPTPAESLEAAKGPAVLERVRSGELLSNSVLQDENTRLPYLGDILALPSSVPLANVFSIGDVVLAVGAASVIGLAMRRRPTHLDADAMQIPTMADDQRVD
jgi:hypothetical protein